MPDNKRYSASVLLHERGRTCLLYTSTGKELKDAFEVDASVTALMPEAQIYGAGMTWTWNPRRMIFNKVTDCAQVLPDGSAVPIDDDRLYRVVTGLYTGQMLGTVNDQSFGILAITPKDAQGLSLIHISSANAPTYETTILFTHDTHDHFLPMPDEEGGEYGGYTRLATLIQQERAAHPDALVLDAGDFSMGSLFQTIYATEAPELRALGAMGYDATTLGNHEFDYRARGLDVYKRQGRRRTPQSRSGSRMPSGACIGASSRTRCSGG